MAIEEISCGSELELFQDLTIFCNFALYSYSLFSYCIPVNEMGKEFNKEKYYPNSKSLLHFL